MVTTHGGSDGLVGSKFSFGPGVPGSIPSLYSITPGSKYSSTMNSKSSLQLYRACLKDVSRIRMNQWFTLGSAFGFDTRFMRQFVLPPLHRIQINKMGQAMNHPENNL